MSILYDEMQTAIATEADRLLSARSDRERALALLDGDGATDLHFWETVVAQGWTGITIAERDGGLGLGLIELGIVAEACGTHLAGAPFLAPGHAVAAALAAADDAPLRRKWLPRLASGEVRACIAFAERQAPLPAAPEVRWSAGRLAGTKPAVTGGFAADIALVLAAGDDGAPLLAIAGLDQAERHWFDSFDNSRATADIRFAETPADLVAAGPAAARLALSVLAEQAVVVAHEQTGGATAMMQKARDYALERRAFGQPIGAFQSVKHRIAELYCLSELARANAIHAAARHGAPDFVQAAAAARLSATEAYDTAARDCTQIHGAIGATWESGLHLHMRRARSLAVEGGNALYWEDVLCAEMLAADR